MPLLVRKRKGKATVCPQWQCDGSWFDLWACLIIFEHAVPLASGGILSKALADDPRFVTWLEDDWRAEGFWLWLLMVWGFLVEHGQGFQCFQSQPFVCFLSCRLFTACQLYSYLSMVALAQTFSLPGKMMRLSMQMLHCNRAWWNDHSEYALKCHICHKLQ